MEGQYTYYAFISYNSADEKWAKWLHGKLESYSIPAALRKKNISLPKNPEPIFWYKTDLSGTNLHSALENELRSSRHLILICSPESAKSVWVNDEVTEFITSGRKDQIIPFIVSGQPDDPNKENYCFPEALKALPRKEQLRGIDVQKEGKEHALVDVVATMFNLRFDALWQRYRRKQKIRKTIIGSLCFAFSILGFFIWDYTRTKYEYYADYVIHNGVPEGIIPIEDSDLKHKLFYYRFEYSMRKLDQVTHCDRFGNPHVIPNTELADRFPIQHILYQGAKVTAIEWQDIFGHTKMKGVFSNDMTRCDIVNPQTGDAMQTQGSTTMINLEQTYSEINLQTFWPTPKSCIGRYLYTYDDDGYLVRKRYCRDNRNTPIADTDGVCGFEYQLDSLRRIITIRYLDTNGKITSNRIGVAKRCYTYSKAGTINSIKYFDIEDKPTMVELGCAILKNKQDKYGNTLEERFYDEHGKPCINSFGYHCSIMSFSREKDTESCFDTNNKPVINVNPQNGGYHKIEVFFDKEGNAIEIRHYDKSNKLCSNLTNVSIIKNEYDHKHRPMKMSNFDPNGHFTTNSYGIMCTQAVYDADDNCIELIYTDSIGRLANNMLGFAKLKTKYTGGNVVRMETFNNANFPAQTQFLASAAAIDFIRDSQNNNIEQVKLYGTDGRLLQNCIAKVSYEYDNYGNCSKMSYFDSSSNAAYHYQNNYSAVLREYDDAGHILAEKFLLADGSVMNGKYVVSKYLPNGFLYRTELRDTLGNLCKYDNGCGWCIQIRGYDHSVFVSDTFLDENEKPVIAADQGACIIKYEYTPSRQFSKKSFFDENGNRMLNTIWKVHAFQYEYDAAGNMITEKSMDINNKPTENAYGYYRCEHTYDLQHNMMTQRFTNPKGRMAICTHQNFGYAYLEKRKDKYGNVCSIKYFDTQMKPTNNADGIHKYVGSYKHKFMPIFEAYYDKDNRLAVPRNNTQQFCAMSKSIYDDNNHIVFYIRYDQNRQALFRGYCIYDNNGIMTNTVNLYSEQQYPVEINSNGRYEQWQEQDSRRKSILHKIDSLTHVCETIYER